MAKKKPKCEVRSDRACNGQVVRRYKGRYKSDPIFFACIGCAVDLQRAGVKFSEYHENDNPVDRKRK